jgi:hypothetical protein
MIPISAGSSVGIVGRRVLEPWSQTLGRPIVIAKGALRSVRGAPFIF